MSSFKTSFGSFTRIDYGSGHELSFLAYLSLFYLSGLLPSGSERSLVTSVFVKYLRVCHRLQTTYRLEPAGSKGVWGLDDYKFVPFILGAAQLLPPCAKAPPVKRILDVRDEEAPLARDNLLFMSVAQIHSIKRGPFHEHSPVLYNIAATVPNWYVLVTLRSELAVAYDVGRQVEGVQRPAKDVRERSFAQVACRAALLLWCLSAVDISCDWSATAFFSWLV